MDIFIFVVLVLTIENALGICKWNINKDVPRNDPLYLTRKRNTYEFLIPQYDDFHLNKSDKFFIVCPGQRNEISGQKVSELEVSCEGGTKVKLLQKKTVVPIEDLSCTNMGAGDVKAINNSQGKELMIGFSFSNTRKDLIYVNYDTGLALVKYVQHTIYGEALTTLSTQKKNTVANFRANGLMPSVSNYWHNLYQQSTQKIVLAQLIGKQSDKYLNDNWLERGHLAPRVDFMLPSMNRATYFYSNCVPQWQSINRGNWKNLENAIRNKAKTSKDHYTVYTGTEGILKLKNDVNIDVDIYLNKNKLPAPEYIWKVLCSSSDLCVAFVVINNPLANTVPVCTDICTATNWAQKDFHNATRGYIVCCNVYDLRQFQHIPYIKVNGVLSF